MGLFGTSWSTKFNKLTEYEKQQLQNLQDFTERMWNLTNDWNLALWNRENAYNTPEALMTRFLDAGINPNSAAAAIAGNDSASGSVSASAPSVPYAPTAPNPQGTDVVGNISGLSNIVMGIGKYLDTERENLLALTENTEANTEYVQGPQTVLTLNEGERAKADSLNRLYELHHIKPWEAKLTEQLYNNEIKNGTLTEKTIELIEEKTKNYIKEREQMDINMLEVKQKIKNLQEEIPLLRERVRVAVTEEEKNQAQADLDRAQSSLNKMLEYESSERARGLKLWNDFEEEQLRKFGKSTHDNRQGLFGTMERLAEGAAKEVKKVARAVKYASTPNARSKGMGGKTSIRYRSLNHRNPKFGSGGVR